MKTITIVIPTYKEEKNIQYSYDEVTRLMTEKLPHYNYEIMYVDNCSPDSTQQLIEELCEKDSHVKAIFNARNFGQGRSHFYALTQAEGDCAVLLHADMQNPPSVIPEFVKEWENGAKVVIGIKEASKECPLLFFMRTVYYKVMKHTSDVEQIEHFSDFELLDKDFIKVLRELDEPVPYLRGIISELGFKMKRIKYVQNKREHGKTTASFKSLYDFGMVGITSYSKFIMRLATIFGTVLGACSMLVALITFVMKLIFWDKFPAGVAAMNIGVFFLGSVQLFFIGLLGEYILNINMRVMRRPLVIEDRRINFD
ncbi:MAG: glycosyltransferase family 2 protein [Deferribacteraceae bacterium]|jgi:glycosyltransferase involved in cell wall biosynthesis|nr:glycosyltransferase family 2 protein [Deferribacteraceae bacterium]